MRYSPTPEVIQECFSEARNTKAAFAGKSFCLLGSMLPLIEHPGTRAVIIRKTTKMLTGSGGLFDAAIN